MPKLTLSCPICQKDLVLLESFKLGSCELNRYKCGHIFAKDSVEFDASQLDFCSVDGSGKKLRPYQEDGVRFIIESDFNAIIGDQMRLGKALTNGSKVLTPSGYTFIGSIQVGAKVCTPDGRVSEVIGVYPQGLRETFEIEFSDGVTIQCDREHLWQVTTPDRKFRGATDLLLTLDKIRTRYKQSNGNLKYYIPITKPVFFESLEIPIDPYVLGVLLGDGYLNGHGNRVSFSSEDLELVQWISQQYSINYKANFDYYLDSKEIKDGLVNLQLYGCSSNTKFIPNCYKFNEVKVRLAILQGLMDTDGYVSKEGCIQFTSVSEELAEDVKFLCESLGCTVRLTTKTPTYSYLGEKKEGQIAYTLTVNAPLDLQVFRLSRKLINLNPNRKYLPSRGIKDIRPLGLQECTCIKIADPYGLFITDNFIVTHNTPQALNALKNFYKERTPCLILVRTANLWQWIREYKVFCDSLPNGIFPILGTTAWVPPGFSSYIISMDTFGANAKCTCGHRYHEQKCTSKNCSCKCYISNGQGIRDTLKKFPFKLVIADEAHSFKNPESNRSQALVDFMTHLNNGEQDLHLTFNCSRCEHTWIEEGKIKFDKRIGHRVISKSAMCPQCKQYCYMHERETAAAAALRLKDTHGVADSCKPCGLILLTGTAIKNRADEYFIPLNLVNPEKFSSLTRFRNTWLEQDHKGRYSRVKSYLIESFKNEIKSHVLRREKEDVFTDLPPIRRTFTIIEPERESYAKMYNNVLDKLELTMANKANPSFMDTATEMMELRRICGMMKLSWVADYLEVSLMDSDNQKYAVGLHHKDVRDILYNSLGGSSNCWKFSGEENIDRKNYIQLNYATMPQRVGILNMLAGGVGCDFHEIDTILVLERQWNSADEEQFEFRFYNPDLAIKSRATNIEYILAKGTLDEWWFDMIEDKRKVFGETIANHWDLTQDNGTFKQLLERTVGSRL